MVTPKELNTTARRGVEMRFFHPDSFLEPNILKKYIRVLIYVLIVVKLLDIIKYFRIGIIPHLLRRLLSSRQLNC